MASRRFDVGQGAIAWLFVGSLLLGNACSSDGEVSFDAPPDSNGPGTSDGGGRLTSSGSGTGATTSGGSRASGGNAQGGKDNAAAGSGTSGSDNGQAGTASGGTAGSGSAGKGNAGSGNGGVGGNGGAGGTAGSTSGASAGGLAGSGGTTGNAGNAGAAGSGGGGGNGDCVFASFGGHNYYFCGPVESATAAITKCQSLNMLPVTIESLAENTFVTGKQKGQSWLGGSDELKEGEWRWAPSTTVFWNGGPKGALPPPDGTVDGVYNGFLIGQPNNNNVDGFPENCLATSANGWNDLYCNLTGVRAACESTGPVILPIP